VNSSAPAVGKCSGLETGNNSAANIGPLSKSQKNW